MYGVKTCNIGYFYRKDFNILRLKFVAYVINMNIKSNAENTNSESQNNKIYKDKEKKVAVTEPVIKWY